MGYAVDSQYDIIWGQGDTNASPTFTLRDGAGNAIDLTGATNLKFIARHQVNDSVAFGSGTVTVVSAPAGTVYYTPAAGETNVEGDYLGQFDLTLASGVKLTVPNDEDAKTRVRVGRSQG